MSERSFRWVAITPCRDEAAFAQRTLDSVARQTRRPDLWVIVDDGSSDATPQLLAAFAREHDWVRIVRREDRGRRSVGPGVIDAFYAGLDTVALADFDYLCKLDLDLELPPRYFEILLERMERDPRLGTCSGKPSRPIEGGEPELELCGDEMSVGMTKLYRRTCFDEIGGFVREVMWDGIDCHRCRMLGWIAVSWDEPELRFLHLRQMGSSDTNVLRGRMRHGAGQHYMGTGVVYVLASAVRRLFEPPAIVGSAAMTWGWLRAALARRPRHGDARFRAFLRAYQWKSLLIGKRRATAALDESGEARWRARGTSTFGANDSRTATTTDAEGGRRAALR